MNNDNRIFVEVLPQSKGFMIAVIYIAVLISIYITLISVKASELNPAQQADQIILQEQQRQQQQEQQIKKPAQHEWLQPPTQKIKQSNVESSECIQIDAIDIQKAELLDPKTTLNLLHKYQGNCLGITEINNLLREITRFYVDKGYVTTKAYVPEQDLSSGVLEVVVIEGFVESIRFKDEDKNKGLSLVTAFPLLLGKILNMRHIEQGLEQLNRLRSNKAKVEFVPGDEPGSTVILVDNHQVNSTKISFKYDNSGQSNTGELQAGTSFSYDSPLGLNDFIAISYHEDTKSDNDGKKSRSASANYSIPYGYWTFGYDFNWFDYLNEITPGFQTFDATGDSVRHNFYINRLLYRDQNSKTSINLNLEKKKSINLIEDITIDSSSYRLFAADLSLNHQHYFSSGQQANFSIGYKRGLDAFNVDRDSDLLPHNPKTEYDKYYISTSFNTPFYFAGINFGWNTRLYIQGSKDRLFGTEQVNIGGLYSVRGLKDDSLISDTGGYIQNDFSIYFRDLPFIGFRIDQISPFIGFDWGMVEEYEPTGGDSENVNGISIGLKVYESNFLASLTYSMISGEPGILEAPSDEFYFSISQSFTGL